MISIEVIALAYKAAKSILYYYDLGLLVYVWCLITYHHSSI